MKKISKLLQVLNSNSKLLKITEVDFKDEKLNVPAVLQYINGELEALNAKERVTLKTLNQAETGCLIVVDDKGKLLGTLSDGDVRRSILLNPKISNSIGSCYYKSPYFLLQDQYNESELKTIFLNDSHNL